MPGGAWLTLTKGAGVELGLVAMQGQHFTLLLSLQLNNQKPFDREHESGHKGFLFEVGGLKSYLHGMEIQVQVECKHLAKVIA